MKTCSLCKVPKKLDEFYKEKLGLHGRQSRCKGCCKRVAGTPERRCANRAAVRRINRLKDGWLPGEHEKAEASMLFVAACACCGSSNPNRRSGFVADHNRHTGLFRAFVCHPCNIVIGFYETYGIEYGTKVREYVLRFA